MPLLQDFIATQVFVFLIVFARIGSALMLMPGIGDITVPMSIRLYFALALSFVLMPVLMPFMPAEIPKEPVAFILLEINEIIIGMFIGIMSQLMMNSMNLAGIFVAHATSLSSAFMFNPQMASQTTILNVFISFLITTMIFVTDLHHMLLLGLIDSYRVFPMQHELMFGDMTLGIAQGVSDALRVGLMISAPFIVVAFGVFIAMGLVARLVPQIQVFIVSIPVQVLTGMVLLMTSISAMMMFFLQQYESFWRNFLSI
jgi:flagellar biosynthetic protein FliR